jgi:hypothetical protein
VQDHHVLVTKVDEAVRNAGWSDVEEIPAAIDLWARTPAGDRVIFEMKTVRPATEVKRVRAAVAQLLEYRFVCGEPDDRLCLVTDHPISDKRGRFLVALEVAVVGVDEDHLIPGSPNAREIVVPERAREDSNL